MLFRFENSILIHLIFLLEYARLASLPAMLTTLRMLGNMLLNMQSFLWFQVSYDPRITNDLSSHFTGLSDHATEVHPPVFDVDGSSMCERSCRPNL